MELLGAAEKIENRTARAWQLVPLIIPKVELEQSFVHVRSSHP